MTIKIELSDAVITEAWDKFGILDDMRAAISAALEAMVEEGTARLANCEIDLDADGDTWCANEVWISGDFPALIIRLGDKP